MNKYIGIEKSEQIGIQYIGTYKFDLRSVINLIFFKFLARSHAHKNWTQFQ